jgi:membrane-associated phospholipid phosphatase
VRADGGLDTTWFRDVEHFERHTGWLHGFLTGWAIYGVIAIALLLLGGWLLARRTPDPARRVSADVWSAGAVVVAVALAQPIASAVDRMRPFTHPALHVDKLIAHAPDPGFPSDHATAFGACAAGLWLVKRWLASIATLLALLTAFSRVYVGVHYPGDVAGGLALGAVVALLGALVAVPLLAKLARRLAATPLRPLIAAQRQARESS